MGSRGNSRERPETGANPASCRRAAAVASKAAAGCLVALSLIVGGPAEVRAEAATDSSGIHYGYALVNSDGATYGTPLPCPPPTGVEAVAALPSRPPIVVRAVGASFFLDPTNVGGEVVARSDGSINGISPIAGLRLAAPIVGVATAPAGTGYWLAGADGGVFAVNDAPFLGSLGGVHLNAPIVGIAPTVDGLGYWLVGADGGVFAFGTAAFAGSLGSTPLRRPIVGIATPRTGSGYWLAAADGSVYPFGDAVFYGSREGQPLNKPIVSIAATIDGLGYWLAGADGGVFVYGDAVVTMSLADRPPLSPIVAIALWPQQCPS